MFYYSEPSVTAGRGTFYRNYYIVTFHQLAEMLYGTIPAIMHFTDARALWVTTSTVEYRGWLTSDTTKTDTITVFGAKGDYSNVTVVDSSSFFGGEIYDGEDAFRA
jgi:hypothetical protein